MSNQQHQHTRKQSSKNQVNPFRNITKQSENYLNQTSRKQFINENEVQKPIVQKPVSNNCASPHKNQIHSFEFERTISLLEDEIKQKDKYIKDLSEQVDGLKMEIDFRNEKINEQQKWLQLLMNNVTSQLASSGMTHRTLMNPFSGSLVETSSNEPMIPLQETNENIMIKINQGLETIDRLRLENFNLKKQIAYDKKRNMDLKKAFMEMKTQMNQQREELFFQNPDLEQLYNEKQNLQMTLRALTEEVEFLSQKNERFLNELKNKEFYTPFKEQSEELTKLREAHALLINMIQSKEVSISTADSIKNFKNKHSGSKTPTFGSLFQGGPVGSKKVLRKFSDGTLPIKKFLTCNSNNLTETRIGNNIVEEEPFETMESLQIQDIDQYLEVVLNKCKSGSSRHRQVNFMEL